MAKRKRTLLGTLLVGGLAVGLSFNTNVRNVFTPGPDTLNFDGVPITEDQLDELAEGGVPDSILVALVALSTVEDSGPDPEITLLREDVAGVRDLVTSLGASIVETNDRVAQLSENVQELARTVALEPLPAVFLVSGDSLTVADSIRTWWVWEHWRGRPLPERRTE